MSDEMKEYEWLGPSAVVLGHMRGQGAFYKFSDDEARSLAEQGFIKLPEEPKEETPKPAAKKKVKTATRRGPRHG